MNYADHALFEQLLFKTHSSKSFGSITMTLVTIMIMGTFLGKLRCHLFVDSDNFISRTIYDRRCFRVNVPPAAESTSIATRFN